MTILADKRHDRGWPKNAPESTWPTYNAPGVAHRADYSDHRGSRTRRELRGPLYINSIRIPFDLAYRVNEAGILGGNSCEDYWFNGEFDLLEELNQAIRAAVTGFGPDGVEL